MKSSIVLIAFVAFAAGAALQKCTPTDLLPALSVTNTEAGPDMLKCAGDVGLKSDELNTQITWTEAQQKAFLNSANCQAFLTAFQKGLKAINPPCLVKEGVSTADIASYSIADYIKAQANPNAAPKSSASGLVTSMAALTGVAMAMMEMY